MSREYKVDPRRTASLLDVFSCVFQGIIPYGAQLLTAAALTVSYGVTINTVDIIPNLWYCWILAVVGIASIFIPFADGICRKIPGTGSMMWLPLAWRPRKPFWKWRRSPLRPDIKKRDAHRASLFPCYQLIGVFEPALRFM